MFDFLNFATIIGLVFTTIGIYGSQIKIIENEENSNTIKVILKRSQVKKYNVAFTIVGTILLLWGSSINSSISTEAIKTNTKQNSDSVRNDLNDFKTVMLGLIVDDNFVGAMSVFNQGDINVKKGIILELKNKAIEEIGRRQKITSFLCSLNDWITEEKNYREILLKPNIEWTRWIRYNEYFTSGDSIFEEEKQILSIVSSKAIKDIIFEHIKTPTPIVLVFNQKNLLGLELNDFDFKNSNIDFSQAKLFGAYFRGTKNINQTNFIYATYYGSTLFRDVILPEIIYVNHEMGTEYNGDVHFMNVEFQQGVNLINSYFKENIHFMNCVFQKNAVFYLSTFMKETRFSRCTFNSETGFNSATFNGKTSFENSVFNSKTQFVTVNFNGETNFKGATFKTEPEFRTTKMDNIINLN